MPLAATSRRSVLAGGGALAGLSACGVKTVNTAPFTQDGLAGIEATLRDHLAKGSAPGLAALVRRRDETRAWALGTKTLGVDDPVRRDTPFRIASMTKAVTAAAAMMLVEDGKLRREEPVDRLLPELADRRVLRSMTSPLDDTVPAKRPMTVDDVMTFRLGWGVVFEPTPIGLAVADLPGFGMPNPASPFTTDTWLARLSKLPLMAQPGERWLYTAGSNVMGALIERASGQTLDAFFQERILGPLGMKDTGFVGPAERLPTGYLAHEGKLTVYDPPAGMFSRKPAFPAGDSGLVSTVDDFAAFARFLTTGKTADGRRLLSDASLRTMTTDQLTPAQRKDGEIILGPHRGWGHMGVYVEPSPEGIPVGAYGWDGGFGTSWFNDPSRDLTVILMTQRFFDSPDAPQIHKDFWRAANAATA
jgi:CubicO group peptidase (beta-lactamase class C family)